MDRRNFLAGNQKKSSIIKENIAPPPIARTLSGLKTYTGPWTTNEVTHLLKRTMFGSRVADVNYFKSKTMVQAVDELINPTAPLPAPPLKEYNETGALTQPDTHIAAGTTWVNDVNTDGTIQSRRRASFKKWWMGNMVNQDRSIREKMSLFLHNHFSTETADISNGNFVYKHHALLRANALGNFKTLVKAVTTDPGMLIYLNGQLNTKTAPDENYGRELQELFCCGKGPESKFTEADVKAAAQVLTGWRNNATTLSSYFDSTRHDTSNKQFSAFYNNTIITGKTGTTAGDLELDALLTMIFNTQEVAKYVCRRLYRWFVYYDIDSTVETNVIEPLANIFRTANYELKPVLSALFKSEHFFDVLNKGCIIKSPIDAVVGMSREMEIKYPALSDYISNYGHWNYLITTVTNMQQSPGDPPDVSGWKAYYQEPQFHEIWINSDTLPKRNQFTDTLAVSGYTFNGKKIVLDGTELARLLPNAGDPNLLITDSLAIIFSIPLSQTSRNQLKTDILLGGQAEDYYWTTAWNTFLANPADTANTTTVKNRLRDLFKYFMNLAEYQLS